MQRLAEWFFYLVYIFFDTLNEITREEGIDRIIGINDVIEYIPAETVEVVTSFYHAFTADFRR